MVAMIKIKYLLLLRYIIGKLVELMNGRLLRY